MLFPFVIIRKKYGFAVFLLILFFGYPPLAPLVVRQKKSTPLRIFEKNAFAHLISFSFSPQKFLIFVGAPLLPSGAIGEFCTAFCGSGTSLLNGTDHRKKVFIFGSFGKIRAILTSPVL